MEIKLDKKCTDYEVEGVRRRDRLKTTWREVVIVKKRLWDLTTKLGGCCGLD